MTEYLVRRLLRTIVVALGTTVVLFLALRMSSDPVSLLVPLNAPQEQIDFLREAYGLNDPLYVQFFRFFSRLAVGDFGESIRFGRPAWEIVLQRLPATLELALVSLVLTVLLSVPLGVIAAVKRGSIYDNVCTMFSLLGQSIPSFWLGVMAIIVFAVWLRWVPTSGRGDPVQLILPSFSLAAYFIARIVRVTRSSMLDVLAEDYVRTARSKGLHERIVIFRHAVRNASISIATLIGYTFASLVGGAVVVETVFAWPGIGRLLVESVDTRDYPVAQAAVLFIALFVTSINFITDISYGYLDPRIRRK